MFLNAVYISIVILSNTSVGEILQGQRCSGLSYTGKSLPG